MEQLDIRLEDFDDPKFDPLEQQMMLSDYAGDPFEVIREAIRRGGPVQEGTLQTIIAGTTFTDPTRKHFAILGADEAKYVLGRAELFSQDAYVEDVRRTFGRAINTLNPPEHTKLRRILQKLFLPHVVAKWSTEYVQPVIDELVADLKKSDKAEMVRDFTHKFPFRIIFRQLNLPERDVALFQKLSETLSMRMEDMSIPMEASRKLGDYLGKIIEYRREHPGKDIISDLIHTEVDGERLSDEILVSFFRQLLNAGGDTTFRSTSNLLVGLLRDRPDQYQMLVKDKSLIPAAVEEGMRWNSPIIMVQREATQDTQIAGVHIPAGSYLYVNYSGVGHDERLHENPDKFDMLRSNSNRHTGFGFGIHVCIGQHLARLEMTRALDTLVTHFPNMRLDPDYPTPVIEALGLRSPREIHVLLN